MPFCFSSLSVDGTAAASPGSCFVVRRRPVAGRYLLTLASLRIGRDVVAPIARRRGVGAASQVQQLDAAELNRVAFALQRDMPAIERLAVRLHLGPMARYDAASVNDPAVLDDRAAVDEVHDPLAAENERLREIGRAHV